MVSRTWAFLEYGPDFKQKSIHLEADFKSFLVTTIYFLGIVQVLLVQKVHQE